MKKFFKITMLSAVALALAACGQGGSDGFIRCMILHAKS